MEEDYSEGETIEQQNFLLYTEKDFLLNEVLMGNPITIKHEQAILQKTVEEIDELPSIIINRTKGNILHYKYAMEEFADLKLSENYFKMYLNPREWNPEKLYLNHEINHDVDRKRRQLCINLNETIANQQSLCWEFIPRMKILKAYITFLKEENTKLIAMIKEKEERKQQNMNERLEEKNYTSAALQENGFPEEDASTVIISPLTQIENQKANRKAKKGITIEAVQTQTKRKRGRPKKQKLTGFPKDQVPHVHAMENQFPFPKKKKPLEEQEDEIDDLFPKENDAGFDEIKESE